MDSNLGHLYPSHTHTCTYTHSHSHIHTIIGGGIPFLGMIYYKAGMRVGQGTNNRAKKEEKDTSRWNVGFWLQLKSNCPFFSLSLPLIAFLFLLFCLLRFLSLLTSFEGNGPPDLLLFFLFSSDHQKSATNKSIHAHTFACGQAHDLSLVRCATKVFISRGQGTLFILCLLSD